LGVELLAFEFLIFYYYCYVGNNSSSEVDSVVGDESDNEGEVDSVVGGESDNEGEVDLNRCNTGWADAMSRVLRLKKPRRSRSVVLSRAKKLNEGVKTSKEEDRGLEVGDIKPKISSLNEQHSRRKVGNSIHII
jgi:hypothetical protein